MLSILCIGIQSSMLSQMNKVSLSVASTAFFLFLFFGMRCKTIFSDKYSRHTKNVVHTTSLLRWLNIVDRPKKEKKKRDQGAREVHSMPRTLVWEEEPPSPPKKRT